VLTLRVDLNKIKRGCIMKKESEENIKLEAKLEEYRQIRSSMQKLDEREGRNLYFMFLVFVGVISVGFKWQYSILYMTSSFILLYLWLDEIKVFISIKRLGTYIEVFIEREIYDLKHYTSGVKNKLLTKWWHPLGLPANSIIPIFSLMFFILAIHFKDNLIPNICHQKSILYFNIYLFSFLAFFIYLLIWSIFIKLKVRDWEKDEWERIQKGTEQKQ
jgi:hypothetical protein